MSLIRNVKENPESLELTYRWFEPWHKAAILFFVVWNALSTAMFYPEVQQFLEGDFSTLRRLSAICVFAMLWLVPTYWMLVLVLNRTVLRMNRQRVNVWHGPLPWLRRNTAFDLDELNYIWVNEIVADPEDEDDTDTLRHVMAVLRNGESRSLIPNIPDERDSEMVRLRIHAWLRGGSCLGPTPAHPPAC
ncbi:MAG: hypothetical protein ACLFRG_19350 [Desulfococcaceae bacterium]